MNSIALVLAVLRLFYSATSVPPPPVLTSTVAAGLKFPPVTNTMVSQKKKMLHTGPSRFGSAWALEISGVMGARIEIVTALP